MRAFKTVLLAGAAMLAASAAQAETNGWYMGAGVGANLLQDSDVSGPGVNGSAEYDLGWGLVGEAGYGFGDFRLGGELGWRANGIDGATNNGTALNADGDVNTYSLMLNGYYDVPTGTKFKPFLGLGIGGALIDADGVRVSTTAVADDTDLVFAYQGILGVAYELSPTLDIKADYRYFATLDPEFDAAGSSYESEYGAHSFMIGFNYKFGAPAKPAPAAAPVAAPAPVAKPAPAPMPKSYLVFFDFDKSALTPEANSVVGKAAASYKAGAPARIEVTGHADRSGTDKYNLALSQKRADVVKAALVKQGIAADQIAVVAKGESTPLVQTPDGVREPQNRRVEIVLP